MSRGHGCGCITPQEPLGACSSWHLGSESPRDIRQDGHMDSHPQLPICAGDPGLAGAAGATAVSSSALCRAEHSAQHQDSQGLTHKMCLVSRDRARTTGQLTLGK